MTRDVQITVDCADPAGLAGFWAEALGYEVQGPPGGFASWDEALDAFVDPAGSGPRVFFQRVPEGKSVKNRLHLDVRAAPGLAGDERMAALEAEAARLAGLGATVLARVEPAPPLEHGHVVLSDPEGNEFCLD
jgi:catechol 2,3-dioxygenase-like lactoylglutathione lyase family enzyme